MNGTDQAQAVDARPKLLLMSTFGMDYLRPHLDGFELIRHWEADDPDALVRREGAGVRALVASGVDRVDARLIAALPDLELISLTAAGHQSVDLEAARAAGVTVTSARGVNAADVADHALGLMIAARREIVADDQWVRSGNWAHVGRRPTTRSLGGERVGILGLGHIGQQIAKRVAPIVADVAWWGPREKPESGLRRAPDLMTLARESSTLFITCPGGAETDKIVSAELIDALGPQGLLVSMSRGSVVDELALIEALKAGRLGQAALDVFDPEPAPPERWADVPNTLLAPHMAGSADASLAGAAALAIANVRRLLAGEPLENVVR